MSGLAMERRSDDDERTYVQETSIDAHSETVHLMLETGQPTDVTEHDLQANLLAPELHQLIQEGVDSPFLT